MNELEIKKAVRDNYGKIAVEDSSCCGPKSCGCNSADDQSHGMGYTYEELASLPEGANLGLGCGNPIAHASLKRGETVLDLGSGAGIDCFLAAAAVGENGKVIGVDMTPEMIFKARENAERGNFKNVQFRLGEIEKLPVSDNSVDIIISNCVINLSTDKDAVFKEAYRVLKPAGRLMVSDIVLLRPLPDFVKNAVQAYVGCIAGASLEQEYLNKIETAGFKSIKILEQTDYTESWAQDKQAHRDLLGEYDLSYEKSLEIAASIVSINVFAQKI
jgi:arsenite methyltransferase